MASKRTIVATLLASVLLLLLTVAGPVQAEDSDATNADSEMNDEAEELAKTIRRLMYILLFTGAYLAITLAVPDSELVRADAKIPMPLAGPAVGIEVQLSFLAVRIVAVQAEGAFGLSPFPVLGG